MHEQAFATAKGLSPKTIKRLYLGITGLRVDPSTKNSLLMRLLFDERISKLGYPDFFLKAVAKLAVERSQLIQLFIELVTVGSGLGSKIEGQHEGVGATDQCELAKLKREILSLLLKHIVIIFKEILNRNFVGLPGYVRVRLDSLIEERLQTLLLALPAVEESGKYNASKGKAPCDDRS